jgi:hypothetical protein
MTLFVVELSLLSRAHRRSKLVRSSNSGEVNAAIRIASRSLECEEHAEITIFDLAKDKLSRALRHGR